MIALVLLANSHSFFEHIQGLAATFLAGGVGMRYLVLAVRALEAPSSDSGKFYRWFYRFTQAALANPDLAEKCATSKKES